MKRAIKSRAVQRTTISKMIKRVEAELDEETPSEKFIRTNYRIMEEYMVKIQKEDKLIWDLMIDDEDNTGRELEEGQDTVIRYKQKWLNLEIKIVQSMKENTRASRLVKSYPITADNYPKVIAALKDHFGDRVILTEVYVRQLLGLVVNNAQRKTIKIEDLYGKLESYLRSLESLGITTEQNAAFLYPLVESSLPEELITVWQHSALSGYNDEGEDTPQSVDGRLSLLLKFLRREVKGEDVWPMPLGNQDWELPLQALVVNKMTGLLPSRDLHLPITEKLRDIQLADPQFMKSGKIDIILGVDVYGLLLLPEIRRDHKTQLCAQNTKLRWIISGGLSGSDIGNTRVFTTRVQYEDNLETILKRFWEVEEVRVAKKITPQDEFCEDLYKSSVRRDTNGRYIVPLPFDPRVGMQDRFGNSLDLCVRRQMALERRLALNVQLGKDHYKFMEEYEGLGHMTQLTEIPVGDQVGHCYLPHYAVIGGQPDRGKFRVVFDASAKTKNVFSFNDRLYTGPKLQRDILSIMMNCRRHRIFIMSDIEKILNTVTYGTAAAPFLAMRTLLKLVEDEGAKYPRASRAIIKDTYVDDIITGADDLRDGMALRDELIELLRCGGFTLKKWSSNDLTILGNIAKEHCAQKITFEQSKVIRTLGLEWIQSEDCFLYDVQSLEKTSVTTKREMLSFIAKLYDPLGWLAPVLVTGKIMVQRLWITGLHWDDPMDESLIETWTNFRKELNFIASLRIPRWLGLGRNTQGVQLHGFGDASEDAYAAAVYIRIPTDDGVSVKLLASKTKLAPIRKMSIPRLELCAALLLTRLMKYIMEELNIKMESATCWSDSTIVLSWLRTMSRNLPTFIGNRVAEIQSCPQVREWRYVPTGDNPADIASRGILGPELKQSSIWWTGPTCAERYQSHLTTAELRNAHRRIHQAIQYQHFRKEIRSLTTLGSVKRTGKIYGLTPFLDDQGILRVGGRLKWAPSMTYQQKHPSLLPSSGKVAQMIVQSVHMRTLHGSVHLMLSTLRQKYLMLRAEDQVKRCIGECVTCCRFIRVTQGQLMSDLPKERLTPGKPFSISVVDYAGPVNLRLSKGRGRKTEKGYICLFVCFMTRAVHLELVTDASTPTFMSAFKRFVARRGHCTRLYSDQKTNFVGAARQLRSCFYLAQNQLKELAAVLANDGTEWKFNPPGAPHFGGRWEAGVKALRYHMRRIIGNNLLTYEELLTVLVRNESCLNSRPLYPMSNIPNDQGVLTPAHFLLTEPSSCVPEDDLLLVKNHLLTRWQLVQRVLQQLWKRWSRDYLNNLQQRNKWKTISPNVDINTNPDLECTGQSWYWVRDGISTLGQQETEAGLDGNSKMVEVDHGRRQVEPRAPRMPTSRIGKAQDIPSASLVQTVKRGGKIDGGKRERW
ncbi:hypothetical protein LAZ67_18001367, partial [Cordylochernes scorpioides]